MNVWYPDDLISYPYLVYREGTDGKENPIASLNLVTDALKSIKNQNITTTVNGKTISFLEAQVEYERQKEDRLFLRIFEMLKSNSLNAPTNFITDVKDLYHTSKANEGKIEKIDRSLIITLIDAQIKGIIQNFTDIQTALRDIESYYKPYNYNEVTNAIENYITTLGDKIKNNPDFNLNYLIQTDFPAYVNNYFNNNNKSAQSNYKKAMDYIITRFSKLPGRAGLLLAPIREKVIEAQSIKDAISKKDIKITKDTKTSFNQTILDYFINFLRGALGDFGEIAVGGITTGTVVGEKSRNPDSDNIIILDQQLTFLDSNYQIIQELSSAKVYNEIRTVEQKYIEELKNLYIIHYSTKMGTDEIKIKNEAQANTRINDIKRLLSDPNISGVNELIFGIANTLKGLVASDADTIEAINGLLIQIISIFMFDDIIPSTIDNIKETYNSQKLNFYNIGGYIVTASDLFQKLLDNLNDTKYLPVRLNILIPQDGLPSAPDLSSADYTKYRDHKNLMWKHVADDGLKLVKLSRIRLIVDQIMDLFVI